jgi:hypothetical protein
MNFVSAKDNQKDIFGAASPVLYTNPAIFVKGMEFMRNFREIFSK